MSAVVAGALALAQSTALGAVKAEVKKRVEAYINRPTEAIKAAYEASKEDWNVETRRLTDEMEEKFVEKFAEEGGRLDALEEILCMAYGDAPELLYAIYSHEALKDAHPERRKMLSHAAAGISDLSISFEDKCRVELALRSLFPRDILILDQVHRLAGEVQRLPGGRARNHPTEGAFRAAWLHASRAAAPLLVSGCVVERTNDRNKWGESAFAEVAVTPIGEMVLHVLRSFIATRRLEAPGREHVPGERGEDAARALMNTPFVEAVRRICSLVRGPTVDYYVPIHERAYRFQFSFPQPYSTPMESVEHPLKEVRADGSARINIYPVDAELSATLPPAPTPLNLAVVPIDGTTDLRQVTINGPYDILRWLAEDIDAWWT